MTGCYNPAFMFRVIRFGSVLLLATLACSRIPARPPALPEPITRLYPNSYLIVWDTVRVDLNNDGRLELDTIDKEGRFVAWERTNSLLLLLNKRNVVTVDLEPLSAERTRMTLQMSAQKYDTGGWSRPAGWYPWANVNAAMGTEIAARIDSRLGHTPGPADRLVPVPADPDAEFLVAPEGGVAPAPRPHAYEAEPERTGWRRLIPRWPRRRAEPQPSVLTPPDTSDTATSPPEEEEAPRTGWRRLWPFGRSN